MAAPVQILGIAGSLRQASYHRAVMISTAAQRFDERGHLTDETSRKLIGQLLVSLVAWTRRLAASR